MRDLRRPYDDEPLPGSDRVRERFGAIPTLAGEITGAAVMGSANTFPFLSWALSAQFKYPTAATGFLCQCESAPEAFFARAFVDRPGMVFDDGPPRDASGTTMRLQVRHGKLRVDAVAERGSVRIAIEIDGMTFHARKYDQVAADYLRERRLIALGYVLVRFTAQEVFAAADDCWRQVAAIIAAHERRAAS